MALGSILLAILTFLCAAAGFLMTFASPDLGHALSFVAPALAIGGSITGGVAMSRAKKALQPTDLARTAVILNAIAFVPAMFVAFFCGVCNSMCTTGEMRMHKQVSFGVDPNQNGMGQGGVHALPPPPFAGAPALPQNAPPPTGGNTPKLPPPTGTQPNPTPAPAFPPPPLPAGPGGKPGSH